MWKTSATVCVLVALVAACDNDDVERSIPAATQRADTATEWFDLQLQLVEQTMGFSPPVASRAFAYSGVTLYEAVVHGMPGYASLAGEVDALPALPQPLPDASYYWPAVANAALATITRQLFPTASADSLAAVDALEAELAASYTRFVSASTIDRSAQYGNEIASAIFVWSMTDGGDQGYLHNFPTSYVAPVGAGLWVPTPPLYQPALQPTWGMNRPFALSAASDCPAPAPPAYSTNPSSVFFMQAQEVYDTSLALTAEEEQIAQFWSDAAGMTATPAGHWIEISTQVLRDKNATLDVAAVTYARVAMAMADAFIANWAIKYQYNVVRPVTFLRSEVDASWSPLLGTPPFPEYPSGHSTQSSAAAQVLTDLFGMTSFTDPGYATAGFAPRSFDSFFAAAQEAAISRMYGGIHYRAAIENGLDQGRCVGMKVSALRFQR